MGISRCDFHLRMRLTQSSFTVVFVCVLTVRQHVVVCDDCTAARGGVLAVRLHVVVCVGCMAARGGMCWLYGCTWWYVLAVRLHVVVCVDCTAARGGMC